MKVLLFIAVSVALFFASVFAAEGPWVKSGPVEARLISPVNAFNGLEVIPLALELKMDKGWKTYWRVPGAAGAAPKIKLHTDWAGKEVNWHWPAPSTYTLLGFQTYGYDKSVVIPFDVSPTASGINKALELTASVYICNEICLPISLDLELLFSNDPNAKTDWKVAPLYNQYMSRVPKTIQNIETKALVDDDGFYLDFSLPQPGKDSEIFLENLYVYEWSAPVISQENGNVRVWWQRTKGSKMPKFQSHFDFTYKDSLQAFSTSVSLVEAARPMLELKQVVEYDQVGKLIWMLLFAFLGGLILNAMPCVLPILSIKLMSWIEWRNGNPNIIRAHALSTAAGVISFFWIIAGILIAIKTMGGYIGWGIQFQNPWFLAFLLLIMLIFLANLLDKFSIQLPQSLQGRVLTVGNEQRGLFKSYLQGGTATLLATPCSAPFLGAAIAFAFTQSNFTLLLIFTSLALGLALPYIVLLLFPQFIKIMPKPGTWMGTLKKFLAAGLGITIVWLLTLLAQHLTGITILVIGLLLIIWLLSLKWSTNHSGFTASSFLMLTVIVFALIFTNMNSTIVDEFDDSNWLPYSQALVNNHLAMDHTVFLDVTAKWCITCKFNETMVLDTLEMRDFFTANQIVLIKGDWSFPNKNIEALLSTYNRSAIPFNVVLGPNAKEGIVLPELLTKVDVINAVLTAK